MRFLACFFEFFFGGLLILAAVLAAKYAVVFPLIFIPAAIIGGMLIAFGIVKFIFAGAWG